MSRSLAVQKNYEKDVTLRQWITVFGSISCSFLAVLNYQITNSSIREIQGALSATLTEASWITTAYVASSVVVMPLIGWFIRIFSVRTYTLWTLSLFLVVQTACGFSSDLNSMISLRFLSGFFGGALIPLSMYILLVTLPVSRRPLAFMLWGFAVAQAPVVGPVAGGWLTDQFSWHLVFFIQLVPGAIVVLLLLYGLEKSDRQLELLKSVNWISITLMAVGLFIFIIVLEEGNRHDWFESGMITGLACLSAVFLFGFLTLQLVSEDPYINLRLFRERNFALCCVAAGAFGVGVFGSMFTVALYLIQVPQYTATQVGTVIMWIGIPQIVSGPLVLWLMKHVDNRFLLGFGCFLFSISCFLNIGMTYQTGYWELMVINAIRGFSQAFIMVVASVIATSSIHQENQGSASALLNLTRDLCGAITIAAIKTGIVRRSDHHVEHIGINVSTFNETTLLRLELLTQHFMNYTGDLQLAQSQAIASLDKVVQRESLVLAYNDIFMGIGWVFIVATVACAFIQRATNS